MPKFNQQYQKGGQAPLPAKTTPQIVEPRCKVCTSPHRHLVDQMLVAGISYSEIERQFAFANIPRRSISSHRDKHLGYEEAAIRTVIERSAAAAQMNFDEGVERLVTKSSYLDVALQKAYDALIKNDVVVEPKDAVKVIEMLQRLQDRNEDAAVDQLNIEFNAFMQSVRETVPKELWNDIVDRTKGILKAQGRAVSFEDEKTPAEAIAELQAAQPVVDAEVVE